jgi:cell division protein FtsL
LVGIWHFDDSSYGRVFDGTFSVHTWPLSNSHHDVFRQTFILEVSSILLLDMTSRRKQFWLSIPMLVIGVSAIIFVLSNIIRVHTRTQGIDAEIAKQQETVAQVTQETAELEKAIAYLESEEARLFNAKKIGYSETGEGVVGVSDIASARERILQEDQLRSSDAIQEPPQDATPAQQWYGLFFKKK